MRALAVTAAIQTLLEVAGVEPQTRQRILQLVGDLRRHAAERGQRPTAQTLELVSVADGDRRLRGEERQQLEVVLGRLHATRRLDDERADRPPLNHEWGR